MYLGFKILFGSPVRVWCKSGRPRLLGRGVVTKMLLLWVLFVSNCFNLLDVHYTDINEGDWVIFDPFQAIFCPSLQGGVKIGKIAISPILKAQLFHPFGHIF